MTLLFKMAPKSTVAVAAVTATAADLGDWSFEIWSAIVFHCVKSILFFVSTAAGVILSPLAIFGLAVFVRAGTVGIVASFRRSEIKKHNAHVNENR